MLVLKIQYFAMEEVATISYNIFILVYKHNITFIKMAIKCQKLEQKGDMNR